LKPRVKSNGLMHWNYPDFKEIYTVHFSNLAYMFRMSFDVNKMKKNMGVIEVNFEIFELFGTQTI
jgi:hypothetical protein